MPNTLEEQAKKLEAQGNSLYEKSLTKIKNCKENKEDSCKLFAKAGQIYEKAQKWESSGNAFKRAGEIGAELRGKDLDTAQYFSDAAAAFFQVDKEMAIEMYKKSYEIYLLLGKTIMAAKRLEKMAAIYGTDLKNPNEEIAAYRKAADMYMQEKSPSTANNLYMKVAHTAVDADMIEVAHDTFVEVLEKTYENKLLTFGIKEYFLKTILCALIIDHIRAENDFKKLTSRYSELSDETRTLTFCSDIISAVKSGNSKVFNEKVGKFKEVSSIDSHTATLLDRLSKQVSENSAGLLEEPTTPDKSEQSSDNSFGLNSIIRAFKRVITKEKPQPVFDENDLS